MRESLFLKEFEFDDALINRNCYQEEILAGLSTLKVRDGSMDINCETEPHDNLENDRRHLLDATSNATEVNLMKKYKELACFIDSKRLGYLRKANQCTI